MRHAMRYEGGYERNFPKLQPNATDYESDDGGKHRMMPWPSSATGLRYGIMEQHGKRFFVVRVAYETKEIVLTNPIRVDPARHLGGARFSAEPIAIDEGPAGKLLGDIMDANPDQVKELGALRESVRSAMKTEGKGPAPRKAT